MQLSLNRLLQRNSEQPLIIYMWCLLPLLSVILFTWITDDAHITFKALENITYGYGPNVNPDERVMAYTHPLWFLMLMPPVLAGIKPSIIAIIYGYTLTFLTSCLFTKILWRSSNQTSWPSKLFIILFASSYSIVIFQTSGLENSLSHFGIALIAYFLFIKEYDKLLFSALLFPLVRPDLFLFSIPFIIYCVYYFKMKSIKKLLLYSMPLIVWSLFAFIYYGFVQPNTATAKLYRLNYTTMRGLIYLYDWAATEPLHAIVFLAGAIVSVYSLIIVVRNGFIMEEEDLLITLVGVYPFIQIVYILSIGGDFMRGRFLTSAIVCNLFIVAAFLNRKNYPHLEKNYKLYFIALMPLCCGMLYYGYKSPDRLNILGLPRTWIANEWHHYAQRESILLNPKRLVQHAIVTKKSFDIDRQMTFYVENGDEGTDYPPNTKWIMAYWAFITDPFTARIPQYNPDSNPGHIIKDVPYEYLYVEKASFVPNYPFINRQKIENTYNYYRFKPWRDPYLERLFYVISTITREPLFSEMRLKAMYLYYTNTFKDLTDEELYAFKLLHRPYW